MTPKTISLFVLIAISGCYLRLVHALIRQEPFDNIRQQQQQQQQLSLNEILRATSKKFLPGNSVLKNSFYGDKNITASQYSTLAVGKPPWLLNKNNIVAQRYTGSVKLHNDFHYGINKNNQENPRQTQATSNIKIVSSSVTPNVSLSPSSLAATRKEFDLKLDAPKPATSPSSSYFERVELLESLTHRKNEKLLLHRNKRYLLFPEGSSFQLVFDLIIPIVDYTNFAIMGITCAVAWELPSKPPSEIIENFRTKLNDGTFGLIRRNDSTQQPLVYINSPSIEQDAVDDNVKWRESITNDIVSSYQPTQQERLSATVATTSGNENIITNSLKSPTQLPSSLHLPSSLLPASSYFYYNRNSKQPEKFQQPTQTTFLYNHQQLEQQKWNKYNNTFKTFNATQRKTLYASNDNGRRPIYRKNDFNSLQSNNYYNYNNYNNYKAYPIAANKWNVENWQTKKNYHQKQQEQQKQPQHTKIPYNDAGVYWKKDNWWDRNRNRIEKQWSENQQKWSQYQENQQSYQTPQFGKRTGRNRKILDKPPKHRIYPVFGKRRRRRNLPDDDLGKELEGIHTKEHLQTRQKLYGKIEKLYKTRGQNGTACVLRALCETEKVHLNAHYHETPQSFVMELLRSIFALPKDTLINSKDSSVQLDARYTNAILLAHDSTKSCSQQYNDCEYSITYGT